MGILQFIASLAASFAWPITVLALAILLRIPLTRLLLALTHLKYKNIELDFGEQLRELERQAKEINIAPKKLKAISETKRDSLQLLEEAARIVEEDLPQAAIVIAWQAVEAELASAIMRLALSPDYPPYNSALKNAETLREQKAIDARTFLLLGRMRNLRNMAVHGVDTQITSREATEFVAIARGVIEKLKTL